MSLYETKIVQKQMFILFKAHNDEVVAFIDKVAKLLQRRHPEVSKLITEKFVPVKGKSWDIFNKKSLKIPKWYSEAIIRRRRQYNGQKENGR